MAGHGVPPGSIERGSAGHGPSTSGSVTQYSLFGAATAAPVLDDLDGVLLGGGHWVRQAALARLSGVVADRWRADALADAFTERAVGPADIQNAQSGFSVRTAFTPLLAPHAARWTRGAGEGPPPGLVLTAGALRLWAITAGRTGDVGYVLATARPDDAIHLSAGAQLARLGLAAVAMTSRTQPGWRITSTKRLRRLAELLGAPPPGADWPA